MGSIVVTLPTPLHNAAGGLGEVVAEGDTVAGVLASLRRDHHAVTRLILDAANEPRRGVSLFLNGSDVRALAGPDTPVEPGDRLEVVLLVAGG